MLLIVVLFDDTIRIYL